MNAPQIIPKITHRVWIGSKPMPEREIAFITGQEMICQDYESVLWRDSNAERLYPFMLSGIVKMLGDSRLNPVVKCDILRYQLLYLFGGIYIDADVEVLRNFDELLSASFFCADEGMGNVGTAVIGCIPFHPLARAMLDVIYRNYITSGPPTSPNQQMNFCGPWLFTKTIKMFQNIEILPRQVLYPFNNPRLPATVHYFHGGDAGGWTKRVSVDSQNNTPNLAGQRSGTGTTRVFFGRHNQIRA